MRIVGGIVLSAALALAGCTSGEEEDRPVDPLERDAAVAEPAWTVEGDLVGQPVVTGSTAVVLERVRSDELDVVAIDTSDGEERWRHPYSPGGASPGFAIVPVVATASDGTEVVAWSTPPKDPGATSASTWERPVVVADPASGEEIFRTEAFRAWSPLEVCPDAVDLCVKGGDALLRIDLAEQDLRVDDSGAPEGARSLGEGGLFATAARPDEEIGVARDGSVLWSTPSTELSGGDDVVSDNGWGFVRDAEADRYVGTMYDGRRDDPAEDEPYVTDLERQVSFGFDGRTGTVLWRQESTDATCLQTEADARGQAPVPVRCLLSGTLELLAGDVTARDTTTTVQGYDPATGDTTWERELTPAASDALAERSRRVVSDGTTVLLATTAGDELVETATGDSADVDADAVFACAETVTFEYATAWRDAALERTSRTGGSRYSPCTADGSPAAEMSVGAVRDAATPAPDDMAVLTTAEGLVGFSLRG